MYSGYFFDFNVIKFCPVTSYHNFIVAENSEHISHSILQGVLVIRMTTLHDCMTIIRMNREVVMQITP